MFKLFVIPPYRSLITQNPVSIFQISPKKLGFYTKLRLKLFVIPPYRFWVALPCPDHRLIGKRSKSVVLYPWIDHIKQLNH